jgi:hypothetical protein
VSSTVDRDEDGEASLAGPIIQIKHRRTGAALLRYGGEIDLENEHDGCEAEDVRSRTSTMSQPEAEAMISTNFTRTDERMGVSFGESKATGQLAPFRVATSTKLPRRPPLLRQAGHRDCPCVLCCFEG